MRDIDEIWARESSGPAARVHDGQIFNLSRHADGVFEGCFVPYRRWVAQRAEPSLKSKLAIKPLAVCALARCGDALLFGRRSEQVLQEPGVWELAPAGGLSLESRDVTGKVDPALQVLIELDEELAIKPDQIEHMQAFALIDDQVEGVCEIAYKIELDTNVQIANGNKGEYGEVALVPAEELSDFLRVVRRACPSSLALLEFEQNSNCEP
ncbi:MAG: NUDIX hydrolase [Planctomycetota bacterium]